MSNQKVVIVHDWLVGGGAEKVVLELHKMYPDAPIYTSYCTDEWREKLSGKVVTGYLQHLGFIRKFLPILRMWWFRSLDLSDYDLVITSTGNGEAKHVRTPSTVKHFCYCHSPTHFYWRHYNNYLTNPGFGIFNLFARLGLKLLVAPLRKADYAAAQNVDQFIANSRHIQSDIKKFYRRDSVVIHPPVDVDRIQNSGFRIQDPERRGYITVGRLVPNKRVDIIVDACTQLNLPLKVIGRGPELNNLQKRAGPTVQFISNASDQTVAKELGRAKAFLFASFEDFGITPVEAMATGTPVIAYKAGGALDYVIPNKTGSFFKNQIAESLSQVLANYKNDFDPRYIQKQAQQFSADNFRQNMAKALSVDE